MAGHFWTNLTRAVAAPIVPGGIGGRQQAWSLLSTNFPSARLATATLPLSVPSRLLASTPAVPHSPSSLPSLSSSRQLISTSGMRGQQSASTAAATAPSATAAAAVSSFFTRVRPFTTRAPIFSAQKAAAATAATTRLVSRSFFAYSRTPLSVPLSCSRSTTTPAATRASARHTVATATPPSSLSATATSRAVLSSPLSSAAAAAGRLVAATSRRLSTSSLSSFSPPAASTFLPSLVAPGWETSVSRWLFFSAGWVASMVVLGGVTRLTRSGLSMTDWRFAGKLPPLTAADWETEFEKYKESPEYKRVNRGMSMKEFQFIYWMEYAHRMWGRALGVAFVGPLAYFLARGALRPRLVVRLSLLGAFGAAQGFVGWWMVKSGLEEPRTDHGVPRVSPYRLATHLACAVTIYSGLLWTAFQVAGWPTAWGSAVQPINALQVAGITQLRRMAHPLTGLLALTFLSGAFVAGNDAGHAYNTFPTMNGAWLPPEMLDMRPLWHNFFENTATVQFDHRVLALSTLTAVSSVWLVAQRLPLPPTPRLLVHALLGATAVQVSLGLTALLLHVPVAVGAAHQAGALTLFTLALAILHAVKRHPPTANEMASLARHAGELRLKAA